MPRLHGLGMRALGIPPNLGRWYRGLSSLRGLISEPTESERKHEK